ncbi:hypothetical protein [Intrasporangium sp.]|uniref:hypothetical protein n=1 Tax=Intrasporangium sp. TaxID=1925024 RepID=UPI003221FFC4
MSDFNESGELRQVEQDYVGRAAERAEQLREHREGELSVTVRHGGGNTGANNAAVDDHLTLGAMEEQLAELQREAGGEHGPDTQPGR